MISLRTLQDLKSELFRSRLALIGVVVLLLMIGVAIFAPFAAPYNPTSQNLTRSHRPPIGFTTSQTVTKMVDGEVQQVNETVNGTAAHPLGTDVQGRDMLSRVIYGARTSLLVGLFGTGIAALLGITVGVLAGYLGGRIDDILMRGADIMLAFPSLVLALALIGLTGPTAISLPAPFASLGLVEDMPATVVLPGTVITVIGLVLWVWFARVTRAEVLAVSKEEYVKAARSIGARDGFIVRKHVLPNSITPILVLGTIQVATVILIESSLSFLGFSGTTLSWGFDIARGRSYLASYWWITSFPGLAILLTVVAINLVGDWLRDALDPGIEGEGGGGGA
jgi:peptide/nickel transport system permease protein